MAQKSSPAWAAPPCNGVIRKQRAAVTQGAAFRYNPPVADNRKHLSEAFTGRLPWPAGTRVEEPDDQCATVIKKQTLVQQQIILILYLQDVLDAGY